MGLKDFLFKKSEDKEVKTPTSSFDDTEMSKGDHESDLLFLFKNYSI